MNDMTFTVVLAIGITDSGGAVLEVTAPNADVRKVVLTDIDEEGDGEFIDALGDGLPKFGLFKAHAELIDWPGEHEYGRYKLIGISLMHLSSSGEVR